MRNEPETYTKHARQRIQQRSIPPGVVSLIHDYGHAYDAGNGALRFALTKKSFRAIKRTFGHAVSQALAAYRDAYVISSGGLVITAARSGHRHFD